MNDWIANNQKEYIDKAIKYTKNINQLNDIRSYLIKNSRKSSLFDAKKFSNNFANLMKKTKAKDGLDVVKNLHLAYSKANKKIINKQKILLINTHLLEYTKNYINNFYGLLAQPLCVQSLKDEDCLCEIELHNLQHFCVQNDRCLSKSVYRFHV